MDTSTFTREVSIVVGDTNYSIKFPTVGQFLAIESARMRLTNGSYGMMLRSTLITSSLALDLVDTVSTLSVLAPSLVKKLMVDDISNLDLADAMALVSEYKSVVEPWITNWMKVIRPSEEKAESK